MLTAALLDLPMLGSQALPVLEATPPPVAFEQLLRPASTPPPALAAVPPMPIPTAGGKAPPAPLAPSVLLQAEPGQSPAAQAALPPTAKPLPKPAGLPLRPTADTAPMAVETLAIPLIAIAEPARPAAGSAKPSQEIATAPATPALPSAEAFLQWLDTVKQSSARLTPPPAAETTAAAAPALLAHREPVSAALIESLAASAPESTAAPLPPSTPAPAFALPAPVAAAAAPVTPLPSTPMLAMDEANWPQQLGEQIQWRLGVGIQEARIEISPRELGAVDVRLSVDDKGLSVHLSASQASTRELLQAELPRLREALQQGGVLLADAQVGRESAGRDAPQQSANRKGGEPAADEDVAQPAASLPWRRRKGLLDDYA